MEKREPKAEKGWVLVNGGRILSFHWTRRAAIDEAERITMEPWRKCRAYLYTRKATVSPAKGER